MKWDQGFIERFSQGTDAATQFLALHSILEIADDKRVLIENHSGVIQYSGDCVCVKVHFGHFKVCGSNLKLMQMTRERLVISGRIDSVCVVRRNGK